MNVHRRTSAHPHSARRASSVINSAIATGRLTITGGDAASLAAAANVSRDTSSANANALTLDAATLSGGRVDVDVGSLDITSRQDTASSRSDDKSFGASVSFTPSTGAVSGSVNAGRTRTSGDFASVAEQSGIYAGTQGFGIKVAGATTLTGAVIASEADASRNSLSTGTLSATDLLNRESYGRSPKDQPIARNMTTFAPSWDPTGRLSRSRTS